MSNAKSVTSANFSSEVLENTKPVLVDFWAAWCGPCLMIAPVLDELAKEYGDKIDIVKLNVDENPDLAEKYFITSIPALKIFVNGEVVKEIVGVKPKHALVEDIKPFI